MRNLRTSAAYRIAIAYSAGFALAISLLGVAVYFAADANFKRDQDARICAETVVLAEILRNEGPDAFRKALTTRRTDLTADAFGYAVFDKAGHRIAGELRAARPPLGLYDITFFDPGDGVDPARANTIELPGGNLLTVAVDTDRLAGIDRTILMLFSGALGCVILLGIAGALFLGGYLQKRLARISTTSLAIMQGDLTRRASVSPRGDEFDAAASSLNAMLDRIAQLLENLRQVSSDVAHDLRTPLAKLRASLEEGLNSGDRSAFESAMIQSDELLALFAAILRISEVEAGAVEKMFKPIDVSALLQDICETCGPAIRDEGRNFFSAVTPDVIVRGDRELISQAVINLIDNAMLHTPVGTAIIASALVSGGHVSLVIADKGPGVADEDRDQITKRFVRLEASRSTPGHGLGLNLVAAIAALHGGELLLEDNRPGLRTTLRLPRYIGKSQ